MPFFSRDKTIDLLQMKEAWLAAWPRAIACWSPFVKLSEPRWCLNTAEEKQEQLEQTFAMIRLTDHAVVVSLARAAAFNLADFATEILAHEIGHHVYCPADLLDNARLLTRVRAGLPTRESYAPLVANLYADLLINDRLQRRAGLNMVEIYRRVGDGNPSRLWQFYMRLYEELWQLKRGDLAANDRETPRRRVDIQLGARLVRSYWKQWLDGAGKFAVLVLPYILQDEQHVTPCNSKWGDMLKAGEDGLPDGFAEMDEDEPAPVHPSMDPVLAGEEQDDQEEREEATTSRRAVEQGGRKSLKKYRDPFDYTEAIKATGSRVSEKQIVAHYYRERALPHLVRFPARRAPRAVEPLPEGVEPWDIGSPVEQVDWVETAIVSPHIIPGYTTRQRTYGETAGTEPEELPVDLYLGVDCSGSMSNPATTLSYPVLAGAVMALSALRAGSRVMVALSGEPGRTITTDGFVRDEKLVLGVLCDYLGTGTTFGIHRLGDVFRKGTSLPRPAHIIILTDNDIFHVLNSLEVTPTDKGAARRHGWKVAREAAEIAGGGATYVLQLPQYLIRQAEQNQTSLLPGMQQMKDDGWDVATVDSMEQLVDFARQFSQKHYGARPDSVKKGTPQ